MATSSASSRRRTASLTIRIGRVLEAHATGWAVCAVPIVVVFVLAAVLASWLLR
jgi:hypothetical protein